MSDVIVATPEEIKVEEQAQYIPAELTSIEVDKLAVEYLNGLYQKWLASQGAKVAKAAQVKEERDNKIASLNATLAKEVTRIETEQAKAAKAKDWAKIAALQTERENAEKSTAKEIAKLNGQASPRAGNGELTADKLSQEEIRSTVHYISMGGKSFVAVHSSMVKHTIADACKVAGDSDGFVLWPVQPVTTIKKDGRRYTESVPTLNGQPFGLVIERGQHQASLSHSGFVNGMAKKLREKGMVTLSAGTAYQPFSADSLVNDSEYDFIVVKA